MIGWQRSGDQLVANLPRHEAELLRGLVTQIREILATRLAESPVDELSEITGIRTGPSTPPRDRMLAKLLPDFNQEDPELASALRSLHEPQLIDAKDGVAAVVLRTCPPEGGEVLLTMAESEAWLSALQDVRLALGAVLEVTDDMPDVLPESDPRARHLGVYHWLTYVQDSLVDEISPQ
jgi:Domain of unknown function (DUF2017)